MANPSDDRARSGLVGGRRDDQPAPPAERREQRAWSLGEAAAAWAATRRVPVGDHPVRYREAGSGEPVVLVHGLGVSADYWVRNGPPLAAAGLRVLAPDLPGFGRTSGPAGGLDVVAQAEAVRRWAIATGLGPAVYLGHSLSCQTVLELAARAPEAVRGLVLAAPTGEGDPLRRLLRQAVGLIRGVHREPFKLAVFVIQAYLRAGLGRVLRTWRMGAGHDPLAALPRVGAPGVVIVGERDPVVRIGFAERIASGLAGGYVVVVPHGTHGLIFDETGDFNRAVIDFARSLDRRAPGA
jgi:2-hydroxy-6-oxonona-2,4-dienedioate hydrolase